METGEEALEKYRIQVYDFALVDLRLPGMDGAQLLREMARPGMVKIIITGAPEDRAREVANQGADGFLTKPFNPENLLTIIKTHQGETIRRVGTMDVSGTVHSTPARSGSLNFRIYGRISWHDTYASPEGDKRPDPAASTPAAANTTNKHTSIDQDVFAIKLAS